MVKKETAVKEQIPADANLFAVGMALRSGFDEEFSLWLSDVANSQCVKTPLDATVLMRAIAIHSKRFIEESLGCDSETAETIMNEAFNADFYSDMKRLLDPLGLKLVVGNLRAIC